MERERLSSCSAYARWRCSAKTRNLHDYRCAVYMSPSYTGTLSRRFSALRVPVAKLGQDAHARRFTARSLRICAILKRESEGICAIASNAHKTLEFLDTALAEHDLDRAWNALQDIWQSSADSKSKRRRMGQQIRLFLGHSIELQRDDLTSALLRRFPKDCELFAAATKQCLRLGRTEQVCQIIDIRTQLGLPLDAYAYNAYITALGRLGRPDAAQAAFKAAADSQNDTIQVYNAMLHVCVRSGEISHVNEIWQAIRAAGLKPDAVSYVGIMNAHAQIGSLYTVQQFFTEMQSKALKPMPHAYTVLFDCVTKSDGRVDVDWLINVVQSMGDIRMNRHILSAFINAISKQLPNSVQMEFVFETVRKFRQETTPGNNVYATLLQLCCRQGIPQRALDVWTMIKDDDIVPNGHVYSSILKACSMMTSKHVSQRIIDEVSKDLRRHWQQIKEKKRAQHPMCGAFNALLHFYAQRHNIDAVSSIYYSMKTNGPIPDRITFNTVLSAYVDANVISRVDDILDDMADVQCSRDTATYAILLKACSHRRDVDYAVHLFEEIASSGLSPTVECYTTVIHTCIKEGSSTSMELAFEYFQLMKERGCQPTAITYGCILQAYQIQNDVDGAFDVYQEACLHGVSPSDGCHNILISMCTDAGRLDDALDLIKILVRRHGDIAEDTMNSVIRALSTHYLQRSLVLLRLMQHRTFRTNAETYDCLIIACSRDGAVYQAFALYKELISHRLRIRQEVGSALITALSYAGEWMMALRVTNHMFKKAGLSAIDAARINKGWKEHPSPKPSRRKERIVHSALPTPSSLGALIVALAQTRNLRLAIYVFRQVCVLSRAAGMMILAKERRQVFELLIEGSCSAERIDWAVEVFIQWLIATEKLLQSTKAKHNPKDYPKMSLATLAFLEATCKRTPGYESYIQQICHTMQWQEDPSRYTPSTRSRRHGRVPFVDIPIVPENTDNGLF